MSTEHLDRILSLFYEAQYAVFDREVEILLRTNPPPEIRAKLIAWSAQSLEKQHLVDKALPRYQEALVQMKQCNAHDSLPEIQEAITRLQEQQKAKKIAPPKDDPLQQGIALLSTQHSQRAETLLLSSVAQADLEDDVKAKVLSRLALARLPAYTQNMIQEAMELAQQSSDMNLVTAVKKTMDQLRIRIEPKVF